MKAYDENTKYILLINKSITILGCSIVNSLTIGFWDIFSNRLEGGGGFVGWGWAVEGGMGLGGS